MPHALMEYDMQEATYTDRLGDTRTVRKTRRGWQVRQPGGPTVSQDLSIAAGRLIGKKVRERRQSIGMSATELAQRAGIVGSSARHARQRVYEIEKCTSRSYGARMGTLYAIAHAMECDIGELLPTTDEVLAEAGVRTKTVTVLSSARHVSSPETISNES